MHAAYSPCLLGDGREYSSYAGGKDIELDQRDPFISMRCVTAGSGVPRWHRVVGPLCLVANFLSERNDGEISRLLRMGSHRLMQLPSETP